MSSRTSAVEWVETTEEVIIIEECLPPGSISPAVIPALEPTEAPIQKLLGAAGDGDNPEAGNGFYCEDCLTLFQEQNDPSKINGPSFILDFPTSMGATQRALLTLPYGLMIGRSSIPNVGIGVMNHGPILSPGMHFGPFEGEQTTVENAIASDFSWEIYKGKDEYEYIDAARESFSNWMRYVNCARSKDEANLLAVQYKGSILFHCCRPIHPGDELLVWPSSKLLSNFSEAWTQMWFMKLKAAESVLPGTSQIFLCSHCQLSFTTEAFLQRHTESHHNQPEDSCILLAAQAAEPETPAGSADSSLPSAPSETTDPIVSKTCPDCGKVFKQIPHLKRHKLFVHSNKRPYCCPQCRRSFSQASGLIRHQLVHKKQAAAKMLHHHNQIHGEKTCGSTSRLEPPDAPAADEPMETKGTYASESQEAAVDETSAEEVDTSQKLQTNSKNCSECGKSFINEVSLRKHKATVHDKVRPYVCTVCQKGFGQYNDLTRHLSRHLRQQCQGSKGRDGLSESQDEFDVMPFSCAECSLAFSTVDSLQQHISESHSEDAQTEDPEEDPVPKDDPDFVPQPSVAETVESIQNLPLQRPQRHGARSKVSTITKLIAPKRRATACKAASAGSNEAKKRGSEVETPGATKLAKCKWFSCNHCKQTYGNPDDLKVHKCALRQHACGQCDATFNKSSSLKKHELAAHPKSHSCERCGKGFSTLGNLKQHRKINTCTKYHCTSELFSCSFCQFSFTMKSYLVKHIRRHHPVEYLSLRESDSLTEQLEEEKAEKDLLCPHCGKRYTSSKAFKTHICFQQVKVLYLCTDCGKGFANHYSLKQHQRVHTGEKPYSCPHCSKSFSYTGQLNVHLRTHTGEKPYLCTHCGESFRQSGDLKRHERKHTGVRPYSCPECCKSFSRPQSLKAHQMLHLGQRMFKCTQCGKSFSRNYHLRRHHQKMHL